MDIAGERQMANAWFGVLEIMESDPSEGLMMDRVQPDRSVFDICSSYETGWNIPDAGASVPCGRFPSNLCDIGPFDRLEWPSFSLPQSAQTLVFSQFLGSGSIQISKLISTRSSGVGHRARNWKTHPVCSVHLNDDSKNVSGGSPFPKGIQ
jgi:hypothetical protein